MMKERKGMLFRNIIANSKSLSDLSGELCGRAKWYYRRGINNVLWRRKYFYKYADWIWDDELLEIDIPKIDILLYTLNPMATPFLTMIQNKKGDGQYKYE